MTMIVLPPDLEAVLAEHANKEQTTTEEVAVAALRKCFAGTQPPRTEGMTLFDFLKDYIGTVSGSSEPIASSGSDLFADYLEEKKRRGHL